MCPLAILGIWLVCRYSEETSQSRHRGIELIRQSLAIFALPHIAATMTKGARTQRWSSSTLKSNICLGI
jgi:hypothetical protein